MPSEQTPVDKLSDSAVGRMAARGGAMLVARNGIVQALQLASSLVLARLISPADYGAFALALIVLGLARYQGDLGVMNSLLARKDVNQKTIETAGFVALAASSVAAIVLLAAAGPLIAAVGGGEETPTLVRVLAICVIVESLRIPPTLKAQRALRFDVLAVTALAETAVLYAVQIVLLLAGFGLWALVAGQLTRSIAGTAVLARRGGGLVLPLPRIPVIPLVRQALPFQATAAMTGVGGLILPLVIALFLDAHGFGFWAWATVLAAPLIMLTKVVQSVALPTLARLRREDSPSVARASVLMMRAVAVPTALGAGLLTGLAGPIVAHVYGHVWLDATGAVRANLVGVVALTYTALLSAQVESARRARARATSAFVAIVIGLAAVVPLTLSLHVTGAALASGLVTPVVDALCLWWLTRAALGEPLRRTALAYGAMTAFGLAAAPLASSLLTLVAALATGVVLAGVLAMLIDREAVGYVLRSLGGPRAIAWLRGRMTLRSAT
jgi:O-antigen/teichoic acid export membrane protein